MGASSSRRVGYSKKIWRDFIHSILTSSSNKLPLPSNNFSIILPTSCLLSSIRLIVCKLFLIIKFITPLHDQFIVGWFVTPAYTTDQFGAPLSHRISTILLNSQSALLIFISTDLAPRTYEPLVAILHPSNVTSQDMALSEF